MLTLNDGRNELWQWDTGRTLNVDAECSQVHFSNKVFGRSIDVDVIDGVSIIPDILLQTDKDLNAWAFVGTAENGYTKISKTFKVNRRNKPADYVFTPPDQTSLEEIKEKIEYLESIQDPDAIKNAVEDYLEQNPVEVPVQSVNGRTGEVKLTAEDVGAISQDDLKEATNEALAQAKASGEFDGADGRDGVDGKDGADGKTPYIGENGNWWIGDTDTGITAGGKNGEDGTKIYIGPDQPTDGTLYWLDTSESGSSGGEIITYSITAALTNVTIDNTAESANEGESFAAALTVSVGYELSSVKITMGGADITNTAYASGNIYISAVTGDVVITAVAVEVSENVTVFTITNNLLNVASDNSAVSAEENASYTATLTPATDYTLGTVTVTMGGVDVTADVYADGVINIAVVTGDVVITASGVYSPTAPVYELAEAFTGTGAEETTLDYNIVDEDKTFSVAIDYTATPTTGIYVFRAGDATNSLGIRGQGGYYWFAQSQYYETVELATSSVTNMRVVLTHEKGSNRLYAHYIKSGEKQVSELGVTYRWKTGENCTTAINPNGTINDLKIYARVLDETEINEYLGVVEKESANTTYEIGNLNGTTGADETSTVRCRTDFIPFTDGGSVSLDGYYFIVYRYDENEEYIDRHVTGGSPAWFSGTDDAVEAAPYIRVLITNTDLTTEFTSGDLDGTIITIGNVEYTLQEVE